MTDELCPNNHPIEWVNNGYGNIPYWPVPYCEQCNKSFLPFELKGWTI